MGGADDLIELTHLHESAILHALELRYDTDMIYTVTGPILIAPNPFKPMDLYSDATIDQHRMQGEYGVGSAAQDSSSKLSKFSTPSGKGRARKQQTTQSRLPPHEYQTDSG